MLIIVLVVRVTRHVLNLNYKKQKVVSLANKEAHLSTNITQKRSELVCLLLLNLFVVERFEEDVQLNGIANNNLRCIISALDLSYFAKASTNARGNQWILVRLGRASVYLCEIFSDVVLRLLVFRRQIFD